MGEDFLKRRNDRFIRQRDAYFVALVEPDLFSELAPITTATIYGAILNAVPANCELWTPEINAGGPIRFYNGDEPAVEVEGAAAEHLSREYGNIGAPLVAQVVDSDLDEGIVRLRVRSTR
jgi:hypothetical protein